LLSVVIIGSAYPLRGGLAAYNERLAKAFLEQGYQVTIYTFSLQYPSLLFPGKTQYSTEPAPSGLDIRVKINSISPFNWIKVGKEISELKPDLVIIKFWIPFMAPCLGKVARMIRKNGHTRVISILDNIIPHEHKPGDRMLVKYFVNGVDGFVAMSDSVMKDLRQFDNEKPCVFNPHPLYDNFGEPISKETARKALSLGVDEKIILFFGFIRDYKGLDLLLKAMAHPEIRKAGIRLLVAGEFYTNAKPYLDLIKENGLEQSVILSNDFIPDSQVASYFCAADLVVQPYKTATQSGVTQIAYHFEIPMITTNVGGLAEIVPDGKVGYVVEPDIDQIAKGILRFYQEKDHLDFRKYIQEEKGKYSWERMLSAIHNLR